MSHFEFSCGHCSVTSCYRKDKPFPKGCLTLEKVDSEDLLEAKEIYLGDTIDGEISRAAAEIEGKYYGKLTRVEEIIVFARRIGAKKLGIASCVGLTNECRTFVKILEAHNIKSVAVLCKVGSLEKTDAGIPEELKISKDEYEAICNPIMQAKILNKEKTDLNVVIGLCVGHDSLFYKYSEAPATTLVTKDRVLAHNPAGALYVTNFYYNKLLKDNL